MDKKECEFDFFAQLLNASKLPDWTDQEWAALCEDIPMTQELFEGCLYACVKARNFHEYIELFERFPKFGKVWCEKLDAGCDSLDNFLTTEDLEVPEHI